MLLPTISFLPRKDRGDLTVDGYPSAVEGILSLSLPSAIDLSDVGEQCGASAQAIDMHSFFIPCSTNSYCPFLSLHSYYNDERRHTNNQTKLY